MIPKSHLRTAIRIASVSLILAAIASPTAWFVAREQAEEAVVSLAREESERLLRLHDALRLSGPQAAAHAQAAAHTIAGGLFDIAEIYDTHGNKLAEATTEAGHAAESALPHHGRPSYRQASYESLHLADGRWLLRVFVPLHAEDSAISGYFEGVRIIPAWQQRQIQFDALSAALMAGLASLLCGMVLYPVVIRLYDENARKTLEVLDSHIAMMEALGRAIAKRDSDTGAHNYRVAWMAARIATVMGLSGNRMQALIAGSFLHDVGKIGVPDAVLLKPGRLDADEMAIMRTHVTLGEEIVTGMGWLEGAAHIVANHHEKWDGSGYPRGIAGADIPLEARIFALVDVFDALCSKRPYKAPLPFAEAVAIITRDSGTHFDPGVIAAFLPLAETLHRSLYPLDESGVRALLATEIHQHFAC